MTNDKLTVILFLSVLLFAAIFIGKSVWEKKRRQRQLEERHRKKGEEGEENTAYFLHKVRGYKKILHHVYVPKSDGSGTAEIDLVMVHKKGLIVIENKNYTGSIYGKNEDYYWTQILPDGGKRSFYNPVKQNNSHIRHLKRFLSGLIPNEVPYISVITFNSQARLKRIMVDQDTAVVLNSRKIKRRLRKRLKRLPNVLGRREVEEISLYLEEYAGDSRKNRRRHERQVKYQMKGLR